MCSQSDCWSHITEAPFLDELSLHPHETMMMRITCTIWKTCSIAKWNIEW